MVALRTLVRKILITIILIVFVGGGVVVFVRFVVVVIDIVFVVPDGGQPGSAGFQADAHRRAIDECAALGVTGNNVTLDTTSLEHTLDVIGRYGANVIGARSS